MNEIAKAKELSVVPSGKEYELDVARMMGQVIAIQHVMALLMKPDVHFGIIPGTAKPTLYQPGADKLAMLFRLRPRYRHTRVERPDFISIETRCRLIHIPTGEEWGEGFGSANSKEDKYLNQSSQKACPECGKPTVFRSKARNGEDPETLGWYCWDKKGGCGRQFTAKEPRIVGASAAIVGDKVWNLHNTIIKISMKRAKVAAILTATAASDIFTQDLEDLEDSAQGLREHEEQQAGAPAAKPNGNGNGQAGGSNGNGVKRASPVQIRGLMEILQDRGVPFDRRLGWMNSQLSSWGKKPIEQFNDLAAEDSDKLTMAAKNGEGLE